jgi:hypothetical protein
VISGDLHRLVVLTPTTGYPCLCPHPYFCHPRLPRNSRNCRRAAAGAARVGPPRQPSPPPPPPPPAFTAAAAAAPPAFSAAVAAAPAFNPAAAAERRSPACPPRSRRRRGPPARGALSVTLRHVAMSTAESAQLVGLLPWFRRNLTLKFKSALACPGSPRPRRCPLSINRDDLPVAPRVHRRARAHRGSVVSYQHSVQGST